MEQNFKNFGLSIYTFASWEYVVFKQCQLFSKF